MFCILASDNCKAIINESKKLLSIELSAGEDADADHCLDILKRLDEGPIRYDDFIVMELCPSSVIMQ